MTENIDTIDSVNYSRHLLKCISKFLPNNPNFCPSFKDIENEPYFRSCVKNLISIYMDSDTDIIISDILKLLKDKLSKYEEFPKLSDEDLEKVSSNVSTINNFSINKNHNAQNLGLNPTNSLPNLEQPNHNTFDSSLNTKKSNSKLTGSPELNINHNTLSEATQRLMDKYTGIRKDTKFPIRSLGISNYVLIFLKLMLYIFEVNYKFNEGYTDNGIVENSKRNDFENYFVNLFTKNTSPFHFLKLGIIKKESLLNPNISSILTPHRLPSKTFKQLLRFLINIKSTSKLDECVEKIVAEDQLLLPNMKALIRKSLRSSSARTVSNSNYMKIDDEKLESIEDMCETRDEIDSHIEYLLSYIANSNNQEYMEFLEQILLVNPGPEAFKDRFILQELEDKYKRTDQENQEVDADQILSEELQNSFDNMTLNTSSSNISLNSNNSSNENGSKFVVIPAYLALFTSNLLFSTEYISFFTFNDIKSLTNFIGFVHKLHKTYKRTIFRKCLLLAFSHALQVFVVNKTTDYFKFTHNNTTTESAHLKKELTSIFSSIYSSFDALRLINDIYGNSTGSLINYKSPPASTPSTPKDKESSQGSNHSNSSSSVRKSKSFDVLASSPDTSNLNDFKSSTESSLLSIGLDSKKVLSMLSKKGLVFSHPGDAFKQGITNIEDSLLNPGDTSVLKALTMISLFNVDVFTNYLNKASSKGLEDVAKQDHNNLGLQSSQSHSSFMAGDTLSSPSDATKHRGLNSFVNIIKNKDTKASSNSPASSSHENTTMSITSQLENQTKIMGQTIKNNILKMPKIQTYYSSNKEIKFWSGVIKHFSSTNSADISDKSNLHILSALMLLHIFGGYLKIQSCDSPISTFASRLNNSFSYLFDIQYELKDIPKHLVHVKNALERNPVSKVKLSVERIVCSLMMTPVNTLETLDKVYKGIKDTFEFNSDLTFNLYCISEALRFFFYIPDKIGERALIYDKTMVLMKKITVLVSNSKLNTIPFLNVDAAGIIDDIIIQEHKVGDNLIDFFIGKLNDKFNSKFMEASEKCLSSDDIFDYMSKDKDKLEKEFLEYSIAFEEEGNSQLKHSIIDENNFQISDVQAFLTNSLVANTIAIMKVALDFKNLDFLNQSFNNNLKDIEKILLCGLLSNDSRLVDESVSCYRIYLSNIMTNTSGTTYRKYYESGGVSITLMATAIFNLNCPESIRYSIMQIISDMLSMRKQMSRSIYSSNSNVQLNSREEKVLNNMPKVLFRCILVNLSFNDVKTHKILKKLCEHYQDEVDLYCKYHKITTGINDMFYTDLAKSVSAYSNVFGPIAFQRHVRSDITKHVKFSTKALFDCFLVLSDKVFEMMVVGDNNLSRDDQVRYRNYSGILASFIGIFNVRYLTDKKDDIVKEYADVLQKRIDMFVEKQCDLLSSSDLLIRENSKDILSLELHPGAYNILFKTILKKLQTFEREYKENKADTNPYILEQIMTVIRLIFERKEIQLIILSLKSVIDIFDKMFMIIHMMDYHSPFRYKSIMYICKAVDSFQYAENYFFTSGAYALKNKWLNTIFNWFNEVAFVDLDLINLTKSHREMDIEKRDLDYLRLDTAIECVKALTYLSKNFTLEAPAATTTVDLEITKKSVLSNFFNILLKALKRSADVDKVPFVLKHKTLILSENILTCLKNLLNCAPTIGLHFILPIAYTDNGIMKRIILDILIDLTKKVANETTEMNQEQEESVNEILKQFLKHPYLLRTLALQCPYNDMERLASSLLRILAAKNITHIFIADLIEDEINFVSRNMDILRRNSLATRTLAIFSRVKGSEFLDFTIKPLVEDIVVKGLDFEIEKPIENPIEKAIQVERFVNCIDKFADNIEKSFDYLPDEFFYISQKIYQAANRKFPGSELISVGSFIFLRFFCPAIINPESASIKERISASNRRSLILVAKFLQNLVNQTISSLKWPLLEIQKSKIDEWNMKLFNFLAKVSSLDRHVSIKSHWEVPLKNLESVGTLHTLLYSNVISMKTAMIDTVIDKKSFDNLISSSKILDSSLQKLGQPTLEVNNGIPEIIRNNAEKYSLVYDFMNRHYLKVGSRPEVNGLIFLSSDSSGTPRINISLKLIENENVDVNEVVYKLIFLESNLWTKKFSILVDGTAAAIDDMDKIKKIMNLFMNLLPKDSFLNLDCVVFYNISPLFLELWKAQSVLAHEMFDISSVKHKFITSNCSLREFESLQLRHYSSEIYHDVRITLLNTSYYQPLKKRFVPVSLKIGNKSIQVINETPKRIKFSDHEGITECYANSMYYMTDVEEVKASSVTGVPCEFTIQFKNGFRLILSSPKYLEILKIILYAKDKLDEITHLPISESEPEPVKKNSAFDLDTLTKIFMVSLSGCSSKNPEIISRGFALYVTARKTFNLDFEYDAYPCIEATLPEDTTSVLRFTAQYLSTHLPEMTYYAIKNCTEGMISGLLQEDVLLVISLCSYWVPNILNYVYLDSETNGKEKTTQLIHSMIKCTFLYPHQAPIFKMFIWYKILCVPELLELIVDEIITFSMDKESEGSDWSICTSILSSTMSIPICSLIIQRLLKLVNNLVPSLTNDNNMNSWSEVLILLSILKEMSFSSYVLFERYIPEVLYILSMLIDVRPAKVKVCLLKILTNICYSFIESTAGDPERRKVLVESIEFLSSPKARYIFGLTRENPSSYYASNASSLLLKVSHMSDLINFMLTLIRTISKDHSNELLWKAKYKDLIVEAIFGEESYISARAMIYLSILFMDFVYDELMKSLIQITLNVMADISNSEESTLHLVTHIIAYGNYVSALDSSNFETITQLAWMCHTFVMSTNLVFFHAGVIAATKCLEKLLALSEEEGINISEMIWLNGRGGLEKELHALESFDNKVSTRETLIFSHMHVISKALMFSHTKEHGMQFLRMLLKLIGNECMSYGTNSDILLCLLFWVYLLEDKDNFEKAYELYYNKKEIDYTIFKTGAKVPTIFVDWLSDKDNFTKNMTLYQVSILMSIDILEEETKSTILDIALHVIETQPEIYFEYMGNMKPKLEKLEEMVTMNNLVMKAFELSMAISTSPYYSKESIYKMQMEKRLKDLQMEAISKLDILSEDTVSEEYENELLLKGIKRRRYYINILNKIVESV
ncbi:uncharacterized protein HGUI_02167 [Hanseniaspora guilliermondii]|uniref:Ras-GAP domain-containing protein n=1 Tax=Hanseniaspora guilliermondii TaxID=56406 RepID=A0A1L0CYJ5_9ASCO|nr:uncharacterized protein HGUI_02167 [Hanseniaspora guilliermondii]